MSILSRPFGRGCRSARALIRDRSASGYWTDEARARWRKDAYSEWKHLQHHHPGDRPLISYYAGFVSVLKSDRSLASDERLAGLEQTREQRKEVSDALACFR